MASGVSASRQGRSTDQWSKFDNPPKAPQRVERPTLRKDPAGRLGAVTREERFDPLEGSRGTPWSRVEVTSLARFASSPLPCHACQVARRRVKLVHPRLIQSRPRSIRSRPRLIQSRRCPFAEDCGRRHGHTSVTATRHHVNGGSPQVPVAVTINESYVRAKQ